MSNFIELTSAVDGDSVLINLDHIELIYPRKDGGAKLVVSNSFNKDGTRQCLNVRESYNLVKQLIRGRKSLIDNAFSFELKEEFMSIVCDKICRYRDAASSQDDLDKICEHCPLVNFFEVM